MAKPSKEKKQKPGKASTSLKVKTGSDGTKRFKSGKRTESAGKSKGRAGNPDAEPESGKKRSNAGSSSGTPERKKRKTLPAKRKENGTSMSQKNPKKKAQPVDRKAKKELAEARKRKRKPNFDMEKEVVLLWEKMRQRNLKPEQRSSLVSETLGKMKGKLLEMAMSHTSSRVLQSCVKHCQETERSDVFQELRPHLLELAVNTYACHLAQKMLDHANKDQLQQMLSALHGNVVRLLRHPSGSSVVEHAYQLASASQKHELVAEFYSPEYRIFRNISNRGGRISDILSGEPASKHKSVLEHMTLSIQPILEKGIVDHSVIHRVLVEYLSICPANMVRSIVEQLSGPLLVRMIHTVDGARLGVLCVRNGSPKERKKIIKALKGQVLKVAHDDHGYIILLSIFEVVDDTELMNKVIMSELAKGIKDLSLNKYGHRLILHLLAPNVPRYVPSETLKLLKCPIDSFSGVKEADGDSAEPLEGPTDDGAENLGTSKKDPLLRRSELLLKSGFAQNLAEACAANAGELLRSPVGKDVIYEVARGGVDGIMLKATQEGISSVHKAIADLATLPKDKETEEHVLEHYHASRTIRRLVLDGRYDQNSQSFAETLWRAALEGKCKTWAQGHSAKVVAAFRDSGDPAVKRIAKSEIDSLIASGLLESQKAKPAAAAAGAAAAAK